MTFSHETQSPTVDILVVDDDPSDVILIRRALNSGEQPLAIAVANDGVEALEYLRGQGAFSGAPRPDLILLDLNMPRMDGRELLQHLKKDDELKRIPVIVLTTSNSERDVLAAYELQASCFLTKPSCMAEFKALATAIHQFWVGQVIYTPKS